jgi:serpin B
MRLALWEMTAMHWKLLCAMAGLSFTGALHSAPSAGAAKADNALSFALLGEVAQGPENIVFSHFSIWTALAMTSAGAEGETLQQMRAVLHLPADDSAAHALAGGWATELTGLKSVELNVANRLWGAKGLPFHDSFLKLTEAQYHAGLETLDFKGDADMARGRINEWVAKQTRGHIKDLLRPGDVPSDTKLVLTNAVYFKGKWLRPFDADLTGNRAFTLASGEKIEVKMMAEDMGVDYVENGRLQAVRLPYIGGQTSMIVVLPRKGDAMKDGAFLDADGFGKVQKGLKPEAQVVVQMPRFEASARISLPSVLGKLGMVRGFTDKAEFGRLCQEPLKISDVIHQAWVKVGEEGTEAAAATAVTMKATAAPVVKSPKLFLADHPFLFFIVDDRNGGVLFAGKVMDPRK